MANTTQWNDVGHLGRGLMRNFKIIEGWSKTEAKKKNPDYDTYLKLSDSMANTGMKLARIIEMYDAMPRIKNLEKLINSIPPHVLAEAKAKIGI